MTREFAREYMRPSATQTQKQLLCVSGAGGAGPGQQGTCRMRLCLRAGGAAEKWAAATVAAVHLV